MHYWKVLMQLNLMMTSTSAAGTASHNYNGKGATGYNDGHGTQGHDRYTITLILRSDRH